MIQLYHVGNIKSSYVGKGNLVAVPFQVDISVVPLEINIPLYYNITIYRVNLHHVAGAVELFAGDKG